MVVGANLVVWENAAIDGELVKDAALAATAEIAAQAEALLDDVDAVGLAGPAILQFAVDVDALEVAAIDLRDHRVMGPLFVVVGDRSANAGPAAGTAVVKIGSAAPGGVGLQALGGLTAAEREQGPIGGAA